MLYTPRSSEVTQSCLTLCDPMDCSLPCSSIHGKQQVFNKYLLRDLGQVLYHFWTSVSQSGKWKYSWYLRHWWCWELKERKVAQSCLTLCDPMDCSLPNSCVHGIFQAIVLEWIAISFSMVSSQPRDQTRVSCIVDRRFTVWATREVLLQGNWVKYI